MKSEFLLAITQLSAEKNLPKEVVISAVESALVSAYRKDSFMPTQNIEVKINRSTGRVDEAGPATPVEVMGFDDLPDAGDTLLVVTAPLPVTAVPPPLPCVTRVVLPAALPGIVSGAMLAVARAAGVAERLP